MNKYKIKLKLFKHPVWALCVMYVHVCETLYRDKYVYLLFCMCVSMLGSVFGVRSCTLESVCVCVCVCVLAYDQA